MIDAYAVSPLDVAALAPVWWALEGDERGTFYAAPRLPLDAARREGLWPLREGAPPRESNRPLLVTERVERPQVSTRPLVILDGSLAAGPWTADRPDDLGPLVLSGSPREGAIVVGVPEHDWWWRARREDRHQHDGIGVGLVLGDLDLRDPIAVGVLRGWGGALQSLASAARSRGWHVFVHGAPSIAAPLHARTREVGADYPVTYCDRPSMMLQLPHVVASDDLRALVSFAALAGPVVRLVDPWRPSPADPDLGPEATHPGGLVAAVEAALADTAGSAWKRDRAAARSYPHRDGHAARRAVDAIRRHVLTA